MNASIAIYTRHPDGRTGVCTVLNANLDAYHTGPDDKRIGPLDAARNEARRLIAECGYAAVEVEIIEYCATCSGSGLVRKNRSRSLFTMIKCPACKADGSETILFPRTQVLP